MWSIWYVSFFYKWNFLWLGYHSCDWLYLDGLLWRCLLFFTVHQINGSLARRAIRDLMARGSIRLVSAHSSQQIYTRATNTWSKGCHLKEEHLVILVSILSWTNIYDFEYWHVALRTLILNSYMWLSNSSISSSLNRNKCS